MFANYFDPICVSIASFKEQLNSNTIGHHIDCYTDNNFPDFSNADVALIIVPENRGSQIPFELATYTNFRKAFYSLFKGIWKLRIVDFGDLKSGADVKDTYFALNDIVSSLLSQSIFPIILGGTQDLVFPIYQSYESFTKGTNLLCVDSRFDLINEDMHNMSSRNFLGHMIKQEPNHLSHFINLAYQSYLCQNDESHLLEKMLFETCRLGNLRDNIREAEPYLRNSDIVAVDLSSIKQSDAPATTSPSPNGLEAHHACIISRYAGMSDRVSSMGIFEYQSILDQNNQTANLIGQIIWYFLEGLSLRIRDYPNANNINTNYQKYLIPVKDSDLQFVFYKSKNTGRWWVSNSIEFQEDSNFKEQVVPCSYEDYLKTTSGDLPKRICRILKRISP